VDNNTAIQLARINIDALRDQIAIKLC